MPPLSLITFVSALAALVVALVVTPLVIRLAPLVGAMDVPDARRVHARVIPRMGGLAMVVASLASAALLRELDWIHVDGLLLSPFVAFSIGMLVIVVTGIADDIRGVPALVKLLAQVGAASIAWYGGARIYETVNLPFGYALTIGPVLGYLATILWIVGVTNAINLIDGLDGLAGGVVFLASITNLVVALITNNALAAAMNAVLAGAILGFLFHNFNPAKIFMGDTGSLFLGYAISAGALLTSRQKESTLASLFVPIIALGVPITDTILAMLRRLLARKSIFAADRGHIHHRLLELGLTHRRAVLFLYGASVVLCSIAVLAAFGRDWEVGAALVSAVVVLGAVIRFARFFDGLIAKKPTLTPSPFALSIRTSFPDYVRALGTAPSPVELAESLGTLLAELPGEFELKVGESVKRVACAPLSARSAYSLTETRFVSTGETPIELTFKGVASDLGLDVQESIHLALALASERKN